MSFERNLDYEMQQTESMDLENLNQPATSSNLENLNRPTNQSNLAGEEQESEQQVSTSKRDSLVEQQLQHQISSKKKGYRKTKVALSHHFRTVRTLNKCKECDNVNFNFQGLECTQVSN